MKQQLVKESPDEIFGMDKRYNYFKKMADFSAHLTHAFGYFDGIMRVSKEQGTHPGILTKITGEDIEADDRVKFKYPGRVWLGHKYISFWLYPKNNKELKKVVNDLESALSKLYNKSVVIWEDDEYQIDVNIIDDPKDNFGQNPEGDWGTYNEKSSQLIPLKDFNGSANASEEDMKKPHLESPLNKSKYDVPKGIGSKKPRPSLKQRQSMHTSESFVRINENPNAVIDPKEWERRKGNKSFTPTPMLYNEDPKAIPFGFYGPDQVLVTGGPKSTHPTLMKSAYSLGMIPNRKWLIERGQNFGRLFPTYKVITFWVFPRDINELLSVLKQLEVKRKINIINDPEWMVEIPGGEFKSHIDKAETVGYNGWGSNRARIGQVSFVPVKDYKGGHTRSAAELKAPHIYTPTEKEELRRKGELEGVPDSVGSRKPKTPLNWRQAMVGESITKYLK